VRGRRDEDHRDVGGVARREEPGHGQRAGHRVDREHRADHGAAHLHGLRVDADAGEEVRTYLRLRRHDDRVALEHRPVGSPQPDQPVAVGDHRGRRAVLEAHPDRLQPLDVVGRQLDAVHHHDHDVVRELPEQQRVVRGHRRGRQHRDRPVAHLPPVAVGAVQHVLAPPLGQACHVGQLVADATGDQHPPGPEPPSAGRRDEEVVGTARQSGDPVGEHLHAVRRHLRATVHEQLQGVDALAAEVVVRMSGRGVAGLAGVDDQHRSTRPAEGHRAAQPGRTATDDHDVVRVLLPVLCLCLLAHAASMRPLLAH
jgi:hypothetical protein